MSSILILTQYRFPVSVACIGMASARAHSRGIHNLSFKVAHLPCFPSLTCDISYPRQSLTAGISSGALSINAGAKLISVGAM
jgi:hypothetical protein